MCIVIKNRATAEERIALLERALYRQLKIVERLRNEVAHLRGDHKRCTKNADCNIGRRNWCPNSCHLFGRTCEECK